LLRERAASAVVHGNILLWEMVGDEWYDAPMCAEVTVYLAHCMVLVYAPAQHRHQ